MTTQFVVSGDGARIAFDVTGSGPALMLLHGAGRTRQDWHEVGYVERLKRDWTVITVDVRGTGESDFLTTSADYAIEKVCADLDAVADACGAQRFAVWGFSFGGNIARYLGAWSDRVTAIAVIGVPFGPAVSEGFDRIIDEYLSEYGHLARAYNEGTLDEERRRSVFEGRIPVWAACLQAMRDWPRVDPEDVRCPTLLLAGTRNEKVISWIEANRPALDDARVHVEVVEGLDHGQEFTHVDRVYPVVSSFLKSSRSDWHPVKLDELIRSRHGRCSTDVITANGE